MKEKNISRIFVILLTLIMVFSLALFVVSVKEPYSANAVSANNQDFFQVNKRTPSEQAEYDELVRLMKMKEDSGRIESMFKKKGLTKKQSDIISGEIESIRKNLPGMVQFIKDAQNGGDFDTAACIDNVVSLISDVASCCGPYGAIVSTVVDLGNTIFNLVMGGESATSDMAQMEDRLSQQLDDVQNQLSEIEEQINGLSNEINESTNTIINEITSAIDNAAAKAYLRTFMLSGEGNFSYNQYRNYIYGASENNSKANTAYYALLKKSIGIGASDEITKYYYDQLYTAIMNDRDVYYDYIMGSPNSKSIVQNYYDVVSARPDLMDKNGISAQYSAILFAYNIYQTELMANQIISTCNLYQYAQMCLTGSESYCYDKSTGKIVTKADIDGAEGIDSMQEQINIRIDEIQDKLICDIVYILDLCDSYIVESADGNLFEIVNSDPATYGNVLVGQTIYLNKVPKEICDLFGFDSNEMTYSVSVPTFMDGAFVVDSNANNIDVSICYNGKTLDKMHLNVGTNAKFNGGNGTASDPYLVASAEQFKSIGIGLDKHYRLICDINFNGDTIAPIGQKVNSNNVIVYDEFAGTLDGNGYTISNVNVIGNTYTGLFGVIGDNGEVADLKMYNVKVSAKITQAEKSKSELYAGIIAGKNNGVIKYCEVTSDGTTKRVTVPLYDLTPEQLFNGPWTTEVDVPIYGLSFELDNETRNRNIYVYAGGIAGANNYLISCCMVENSYISASSTHDFGGDNTSTNKNNVYVGGLCGYNYGAVGYSVVKESTKITSYAKSVYNPKTTVNPYVVALAGGIVAKTDSLNNISNVESHSKIIHNRAVLDCQSKWGEHYKNCSNEKDDYIPNYSDDKLAGIKTNVNIEELIAKTDRNFTVTFDYGIKNLNGVYVDCVYDAGCDTFNTENLKFFINGIQKNYEIIDVYGFDAHNEEFSSNSQNVVILFSIDIEGNTVYLTQDVSIIVKENVITSIEILNLKDSYVKDTFSLEGLIIKYNHAVGEPKYVTIDSTNISQVKYFGNATTFGSQPIALSYNGNIVEFEINVVCGHGNNFINAASGYTYDVSKSLASTCSEIGYDAYVCGTCGDVQHFYHRKIEHTPDYENAVGHKDATCTEEGSTGKVCCDKCGEVLEEGKAIPKLNHEYSYLDENKHACANGEHSEFHHYTITESVNSVINSDGSESWYIVYKYTCVCKKDGKTFSKVIVDENLIVDETTKLPTIMVSDGYALSGGDEVAVYVQLINNPGINAVNFGIRYSMGLDLISIQDGTVLKGSLVSDGLAVNYGYNFVWANDSTFINDGNLLKLIFKVSEYADLGDAFDVSIVYAIGNGAQGGFGTSSGKQYFITKDGTIKVVERLPGDINNDGIVDLLDAIEIGRFLVGKIDSIDEKYANVDLSYSIDGTSNVDVMDMVAILQYITGGYGVNLLTQAFEVVLNTNGYNGTLNDLLVSIYDEKNTYIEAGLAELERDGYKFLGWYDQMVGGNLICLTDAVKYNPSQKKQTLYAHWELNMISFDDNGATSGEMPDVYYTDASIIDIKNTLKKEYNIAFISEKFGLTDNKVMRYEFLAWEGSNGRVYLTLDEAIEDLLNAHYGKVTLKAIWADNPILTYPDWKQNGYEDTVLWYGDSDFITQLVQPGQTDKDILGFNVVGGKYKVYAKHTAIKYNIVFDFNGGTGNNIPTVVYNHSVDNPYKYKSNASIIRTGYEFVNWIDSYGNSYDAFEEIGYIRGSAQGATVTLTAQWGLDIYTITYKSNYANNGTSTSSDFEKVVPYTVETIDKLSLPDEKYTVYPEYNVLLGWYEDMASAQKFDLNILKSNPRNVTLMAKWDLCDVYYITNTPQKITGNRVIVDWSSVSDATYNCNRTIYTENVSQIYFIGNSYSFFQNLIISSYAGTNSKSNLSIHFKGFNMNGYICQTNNSVGLNVTLESTGNNYISAPTECTAIIGFSTLNFAGAGSLTVRGGNGRNATTAGGNGSNGGTAIIIDNVNIDMTGKLIVVGGNGGNGADGTAGDNGSPWYSGWDDRNATGDGADGGDGKDGTSGGNGGKAGYAFKSKNITIIHGDALALGGASGKGGNGGKGGDGGQGQESGGWGKTSGDGGDGGDGGKGGSVYISTATDGLEIIITNGGNLELKNGSTGSKGNGGAAGAAGSKGLHSAHRPNQWATWGNDGSDGAAGSKGADGTVL